LYFYLQPIYYILDIKKTKNNCFLSVSRNTGQLLISTTLKRKKIQDIKNKLTWGVLNALKKLKTNKIKINFLILNVSNLESALIVPIFTILKTWNIQIFSFSFNLPKPHNGCRKTHLMRKRNKGTKKNKEQLMGL